MKKAIPVRDQTVLLSLHEISPVFEDDIVRSLDKLNDLGITSTTLLVTPLYELKRAYAFDRHEMFTEFLLSLNQDLSLHGLSHFSKSGSLAEFRRLPKDALRARIIKAFKLFRDAFKTPPIGIVPPSWEAPTRIVNIANELGFRYCVTDNILYDFSKELVFSISASIISHGTERLALEDAIVEMALGGPLQIAIHPLDYKKNRMFEILAELLDTGYSFLSYQSYLFSVQKSDNHTHGIQTE